MFSLLDDSAILRLSYNYASPEMMNRTDCGGSAEKYCGYVSAIVAILDSARTAGNVASYLPRAMPALCRFTCQGPWLV
jgi:hypothetical protein